MIQVSPNVYVESNNTFCNLGLITTKEGVVIVDTPMSPTDSVKWRDEVAKKGKLRYVITTEEHGDHCTNSWFFPGVLISSEETRKKLAKMSSKDIIDRVTKRDPSTTSVMQGFQLKLAEIAFSGDLELHLGEHTFKLMPLPGHSSGGIGVFIPEEKVIFTTDCVFHKAKTWLQESIPDAWFASLEKIRSLDVNVIVPGHGTPCDKSYLDEQAGIIRKWIDAVKAAIKQGLTEAEAVTKIVPPDPYPKTPAAIPIPEAEINRMSIARLYTLYSGKK